MAGAGARAGRRDARDARQRRRDHRRAHRAAATARSSSRADATSRSRRRRSRSPTRSARATRSSARFLAHWRERGLGRDALADLDAVVETDPLRRPRRGAHVRARGRLAARAPSSAEDQIAAAPHRAPGSRRRRFGRSPAHVPDRAPQRPRRRPAPRRRSRPCARSACAARASAARRDAARAPHARAAPHDRRRPVGPHPRAGAVRCAARRLCRPHAVRHLAGAGARRARGLVAHLAARADGRRVARPGRVLRAARPPLGRARSRRTSTSS